ncbi:MAG: hypothetical protein ACRCY3_08035 [Sphingorhabdus sp.]
MSGYFAGPWPAEDGGPARLQNLPAGFGLPIDKRTALACTTRNTRMSTMTVLGAPGEVFLLLHNAVRSNLGLRTSARIERIDPLSLQPVARSPRLPGGPMWPGGCAVHANGDLISVYGRWVHRLDRDCRIKVARKLPENLAYNSFVVLDNGLIVTKNLSDCVPARLMVLDPETLQPLISPLACPEPSIARLSAVGNRVYVVGTQSIFRFGWTGKTLERDPDWRYDYVAGSANSYGWDAVIDSENAWFMDNGHHRYVINMIGRGMTKTANRLHRVSVRDCRDAEAVEVSGTAGGSITNPPLVDSARHIVVGYDSANRVMTAWRFGSGPLRPLWRKDDIGCASHMLLDRKRGTIITNDYRNRQEQVVALGIETGAEMARVRVGGMTQGVVFPSPGWNNDIYWCSMSRLARIYVKTPQIPGA